MHDLTPDDSIGELLRVTRDNKPLQISIGLQLAKHHEERLACLRDAVDWIATEMMKTPQFMHDKLEDELTDVIIKMLLSIGFKASHDTQIGGHCDIVVEARDGFLWIAEAKVHRDYKRLLEGFRQLTSRYTTGLDGQDNGELIVYIDQPRTDQVMKKWRDELVSNEPSVTIVVEPEHAKPMLTELPHNRTGLSFKIRHVPVSIHFKPTA